MAFVDVGVRTVAKAGSKFSCFLPSLLFIEERARSTHKRMESIINHDHSYAMPGQVALTRLHSGLLAFTLSVAGHYFSHLVGKDGGERGCEAIIHHC